VSLNNTTGSFKVVENEREEFQRSPLAVARGEDKMHYRTSDYDRTPPNDPIKPFYQDLFCESSRSSIRAILLTQYFFMNARL
jgi:hypothetical protein